MTRGFLKDSTDELSTTSLFELNSHRVSSGHLGIFSVLPSLSFDDDIIDDLDSFTEEATMPVQQLALLLKWDCHWFIHLKEKWSQTFAEIEASHIAAVKDLQKLKNLIVFLKNRLGSLTW